MVGGLQLIVCSSSHNMRGALVLSLCVSGFGFGGLCSSVRAHLPGATAAVLFTDPKHSILNVEP